MDWVRDKQAEVYQDRMSRYHADPWRLRNEYIAAINDRSQENVEDFITQSTGRALPPEEKVIFLKLLEMQRHALLMYTSCGWFFDNIAGIETVQVMQYAARSMQLCQEVQGWDLVPQFKEMLQHAPANVRPFTNGREVYEAFVEPARIDLNRVAAHFALSSVFEEARERTTEIYCYTATVDGLDRAEAGMQVLTTGRVTIRSNITFERHAADLVVFYLGDHNLFATVRGRMDDNEFHAVRQDLNKAFRRSDSNEVMRLMNVVFGGKNYSLTHLFKDPQRQILHELLESTWEEIESSFRHIYEHNYAIMQMIRNMNMPLPKALSAPAEFILNEDLCAEIQAAAIDVNRLRNLADEAERLSLSLDKERLSFEGSHRINDLMDQLAERSEDVDLLCSIEESLEILRTLTSTLDLQNAQNVFFNIAKRKWPAMKRRAAANDEEAAKWVEHFGNLAHHLGLAIP